MRLRAIIAAVIFAGAMAVYLAVSGAPPRVHAATIATEIVLFTAVTVALCAEQISARRRAAGVAAAIVVLALVWTWWSSRVIAALTPDLAYFLITLVRYSIEALVIAGLVRGIELLLRQPQHRRRQ